jgi:hypothetical protein
MSTHAFADTGRQVVWLSVDSTYRRIHVGQEQPGLTPAGSRRRQAQPSSSMRIVPNGASGRGRSENSATAPTR